MRRQHQRQQQNLTLKVCNHLFATNFLDIRGKNDNIAMFNALILLFVLSEEMSEKKWDEAVNLEYLRSEQAKFAKARDWDQFHTPRNLGTCCYTKTKTTRAKEKKSMLFNMLLFLLHFCNRSFCCDF